MTNSCTTQIKGLMGQVFSVFETLDERGLRDKISLSDEGLRGLVQTDMLLFIIRIAENDGDVISDDCLNYINECLGYNFSPLTFEMARKKALACEVPEICLVLPFLILLDKQIGGNAVSSIYIQALSYVLLGFIKCEGHNSLEKMVKYYRWIQCCIHMTESILGEKVDYDPLDTINDDSSKEIIKNAAEIDTMIHKEDPVIFLVEEAIRKTIVEHDSAGGRTVLNPEIHETELFKDPGDGSDLKEEAEKKWDIYKDPGDGSELADEKPACSGVIPITREAEEDTSALGKLNSMIGLKEVKKQIISTLNVLKVRNRCKELRIKRPAISMHMVFTGNPGTGKTTVARIIGEIYHEAGMLSKGHFTEVTRTELVGKYVGHTAPMVKEVFEKAKGGVLFIDEAYSLTAEGDSFGEEAIDTLIKLMEDNRDDIVVIVAGYPDLMQEFINSNPGLRSRFPFIIDFPDYSGEELTRIFKSFCKENDISPSTQVLDAVESYFENESGRKKRHFGNARAVRNYFETMIMNQANRLVKEGAMEKDDLCRFSIKDLPRKVLIKQVSLNRESF